MPIWSDVVAIKGKPWCSLDYGSTLHEIPLRCCPEITQKLPYPVSHVFEVRQPLLFAKYSLKKEQYKNPEVRELYHDTEIHNIQSILSSNLDWRRVVRSKYGKGVSFSSSPSYAYTHSNGFNSSKAMIIADVLVENSQQYCGMFPSGDKDTTISSNGEVVVKYCDDEFYPKYVLHYTGTPKARKKYF